MLRKLESTAKSFFFSSNLKNKLSILAINNVCTTKRICVIYGLITSPEHPAHRKEKIQKENNNVENHHSLSNLNEETFQYSFLLYSERSSYLLK